MKFVANDGKVFDTMEECQEYEYEYSENAELEKEIRRNVVFYNCYGDAVNFMDVHGEDFWDNFDTINQDVDSSSYVKITGSNEFCAKLSKCCFEEIGLHFPRESGMYRWDNECDDWVEIDSDIEYFCNYWRKIYPNMRILKEG